MSSYENIYEVLNGGSSAEFIGYQLDDLSVDQRIAAAQVVALAAIAEELSGIRQDGIPTKRPPRKAAAGESKLKW